MIVFGDFLSFHDDKVVGFFEIALHGRAAGYFLCVAKAFGSCFLASPKTCFYFGTKERRPHGRSISASARPFGGGLGNSLRSNSQARFPAKSATSAAAPEGAFGTALLGLAVHFCVAKDVFLFAGADAGYFYEFGVKTMFFYHD